MSYAAPATVGISLLVVLLLKAFLDKVLSIQRGLKALGNCPGASLIWFHPFRSAAPVLAKIFPFAHQIGDYYADYEVYKRFGSTCLSCVLFQSAIPTFWLSDANALRIVLNDRNTFRRDLDAYKLVSPYGPSMVAKEGPDWKRHRAVAKPAFNEANSSLVWKHSTRLVHEWFTLLDKGRDTTSAPQTVRVDLLKTMTEIALLVLSSAAFGRHNSYGHSTRTFESMDSVIKINRHWSFHDAMTTASDSLITKVLAPDWLFTVSNYFKLPYLGPLLRETEESFEALRSHINDMIHNARSCFSSKESSGSADTMDAAILQNLVKANIAQEDSDLAQRRRLSDQELISDIFMFLLAGHETAAHSLSFALCLLALYPDEQKKVHSEVCLLWPEDAPTFDTVNVSEYRECMNHLQYTLAAFRETLRLFPPVPHIAAPVSADTTITAHRFTTKADGKICDVVEFPVTLPVGSLVIVDIHGTHRNPIHWGNDVNEFKPERFIDTDSYQWPRDAFVAFSGGPMGCIGERFGITESICVLAHIVKRYEILVPEELANKSHEEQKKLLLSWVPRATLLPTNAFVNFRRRRD